MSSRAPSRSALIAGLALLSVPLGTAGEPSSRAPGVIQVAGTFAPAGAPLEEPIRVDAGGGCVVDLRQAYDVAGELLSGSFEIDYRILVHGPCETPPVIGKYDEEWIAHGTFTGTVDGTVATGTLFYTAKVHSGGDVEGRMVLAGDASGELAVAGNFGDGRLSYRGSLR